MTDWTGGLMEAADFRLAHGGVLPVARMAYVRAGTLAPDGRNAVLMTHGYTSTHRYVEPGAAVAEGSWSDLVGPGRAIDTDRFFVVSANALGSCYGSSGPASTDPATGRPYGAAFPRVSFEDTVRLQWALLQSLGVKHLHAVAGPSMGGFQALQWGVQFPQHVDRLVVAVSGLRGPADGPGGVDGLRAKIMADPGWQGGEGPREAMVPFLARLRLDTLRHYGMAEYLADQGLQGQALEARMAEMAQAWAQGFHAWSLVALREAINAFDVTGQLERLRARVLLALGTNDRIFPAEGGPAAVRAMQAAGVDARCFEIASRYGHLASGLDWAAWEPALREFLR